MLRNFMWSVLPDYATNNNQKKITIADWTLIKIEFINFK